MFRIIVTLFCFVWHLWWLAMPLFGHFNSLMLLYSILSLVFPRRSLCMKNAMRIRGKTTRACIAASNNSLSSMNYDSISLLIFLFFFICKIVFLCSPKEYHYLLHSRVPSCSRRWIKRRDKVKKRIEKESVNAQNRSRPKLISLFRLSHLLFTYASTTMSYSFDSLWVMRQTNKSWRR